VGEIAVTKRAAHAAEAAVQRLEKEKRQQDFLIDGLQVGGVFLLEGAAGGRRASAATGALCARTRRQAAR
jgi:hypothetical protein